MWRFFLLRQCGIIPIRHSGNSWALSLCGISLIRYSGRGDEAEGRCCMDVMLRECDVAWTRCCGETALLRHRATSVHEHYGILALRYMKTMAYWHYETLSA